MSRSQIYDGTDWVDMTGLGQTPDFLEVGRSSSLAINNTYTARAWNNVIEDTGGWFTSGNSYWTPTNSGLYLIDCHVGTSGATGMYFQLYDETNSVILLNQQRVNTSIYSGAFHAMFRLVGGNDYSIHIYVSTNTDMIAGNRTRLTVTGPF